MTIASRLCARLAACLLAQGARVLRATTPMADVERKVNVRGRMQA